jgi:hypothetical protein
MALTRDHNAFDAEAVRKPEEDLSGFVRSGLDPDDLQIADLGDIVELLAEVFRQRRHLRDGGDALLIDRLHDLTRPVLLFPAGRDEPLEIRQGQIFQVKFFIQSFYPGFSAMASMKFPAFTLRLFGLGLTMARRSPVMVPHSAVSIEAFSNNQQRRSRRAPVGPYDDESYLMEVVLCQSSEVFHNMLLWI